MWERCPRSDSPSGRCPYASMAPWGLVCSFAFPKKGRKHIHPLEWPGCPWKDKQLKVQKEGHKARARWVKRGKKTGEEADDE